MTNWHGNMNKGRPLFPEQPGRMPYLDDLKAILIAAIIAVHGVLGYAGLTNGGHTPTSRKPCSSQPPKWS